MEIIVVILVTAFTGLGLRYFYLNRELKSVRQKLGQKEANILADNFISDGIEDLVANGWQLDFCHSFGLCAKRETDEFFVPVQDAIFLLMDEKIDEYDGLCKPNEGGKHNETPKFQPSPTFATRVS